LCGASEFAKKVLGRLDELWRGVEPGVDGTEEVGLVVGAAAEQAQDVAVPDLAEGLDLNGESVVVSRALAFPGQTLHGHDLPCRLGCCWT
jgi:hypothetical protein